MSITKALFYGFSIATLFIIGTLVIGHLWAFIILISTALIGIAVNTLREKKKAVRNYYNSDNQNTE